MYNLIVAISKNHGIGKSGKLPWNIKEDMSLFSKLTRGKGNNAVIMGKHTWNSLNGRKLIGRDNLILSTSLSSIEGKMKVFKSLQEILSYCCDSSYDDVWIIGGQQIYQQFLSQNLIHECYVTHIDQDFDCDTFFPELDKSWILAETTIIETDKNFTVSLKKYKKNT